MAEADALSRAVESIDILGFSQCKDKWYDRLKKSIVDDPAKYSQFKIEDGLLYKHCSYNSKRLDRSSWRLVVPLEKEMKS